MCDVKHSHTMLGAQPRQKLDDLALHCHIKARRRLVQYHQRRAAGQRDGDGDALLLPTGKLVRKAAQQGVGIGKTYILGQRPAARRNLGRGQGGVAAQHFGDLGTDPHRGVQRRGRVLRHEPHHGPAQPLQRRAGQGQDIAAVDADRPACPGAGCHMAHHGMAKRAFARSAFPDQPQNLARGYGQ